MNQSGAGAQLDARYGRTPDRRRRAFVATIAVSLVLAFSGWLVWIGVAGGLVGGQAPFESNDTGYTVVSDREVIVTWDFTVSPGTAARCAVQALGPTFSIVGWKIVELPASTARTRQLTETLRTTERATSGLIFRCWLT